MTELEELERLWWEVKRAIDAYAEAALRYREHQAEASAARADEELKAGRNPI